MQKNILYTIVIQIQKVFPMEHQYVSFTLLVINPIKRIKRIKSKIKGLSYPINIE